MADFPISEHHDHQTEPVRDSGHDAFGRPAAPQPAAADTAHDPPTDDPFRPAGADRPEPNSRPEPPGPSRTRAWIAGGVAAAVLAAGGFFGVDAIASHTKSVASAAASGGPGGQGGFGGGQGGGPRGGGGVFGTIKAIDGPSLTVTTNDGSTETVTTTRATTTTRAVAAALSDVKIGDQVVVMGTGTTTIAATSITDTGTNAATAAPAGAGQAGGSRANGGGGPPGGGPFGAGGELIAGTVAQVGSGALTVTESSGTTVAVKTSSSTTVTTVETIDVADLAVGQSVIVRGTTSNGTVTATAIETGALAADQGAPGAQGAPPTGGPPSGNGR